MFLTTPPNGQPAITDNISAVIPLPVSQTRSWILTDCASLAESQMLTDIYSLEEINHFLEDSFGRPGKVADYFSDLEKLILTSLTLQKLVDLDTLDEKKLFRLKKHVITIRK